MFCRCESGGMTFISGMRRWFGELDAALGRRDYSGARLALEELKWLGWTFKPRAKESLREGGTLLFRDSRDWVVNEEDVANMTGIPERMVELAVELGHFPPPKSRRGGWMTWDGRAICDWIRAGASKKGVGR